MKKVKPNFKALGPKYGKIMKQIAQYVSEMKNEDIFAFEKQGILDFEIEGQPVQILVEEVEIISEDIPGWQVANEGIITVALDTTITTELLYEGIAREFVNRIQNFRKEIGLEVTDKICLEIQKHEAVNAAISAHSEYIKAETLCTQINLLDKIEQINQKVVEIDNTIETIIAISKA